jgi:hypothetical protein
VVPVEPEEPVVPVVPDEPDEPVVPVVPLVPVVPVVPPGPVVVVIRPPGVVVVVTAVAQSTAALADAEPGAKNHAASSTSGRKRSAQRTTASLAAAIARVAAMAPKKCDIFRRRATFLLHQFFPRNLRVWARASTFRARQNNRPQVWAAVIATSDAG